MKNKLNILAVFLVLFAPFIGLSQNRTIVQMEVVEDSESIDNSISNSLSFKINPALILRGDLVLYAELPIKDRLRAEVGAGITLRDYWGEIIDESSQLSSDFESVSHSPGVSLRGGVKYYASSYYSQPEGYFIGLEYRMQDYNSKVLKYNGIDINKDLQRTYNDGRLLMGWTEYFDEAIFIEFYTGFGLRNRNVEIASVEDGTINIKRENRTALILAGGIKLGVTF